MRSLLFLSSFFLPFPLLFPSYFLPAFLPFPLLLPSLLPFSFLFSQPAGATAVGEWRARAAGLVRVTAVVCGEHDDCVVQHASGLQRRSQVTDGVVNRAEHAAERSALRVRQVTVAFDVRLRRLRRRMYGLQ